MTNCTCSCGKPAHGRTSCDFQSIFLFSPELLQSKLNLNSVLQFLQEVDTELGTNLENHLKANFRCFLRRWLRLTLDQRKEELRIHQQLAEPDEGLEVRDGGEDLPRVRHCQI